MSLPKFICNNFDMSLCGVWLHVTENQAFEVFTLPSALESLTSMELTLTQTSFSPLYTVSDIEQTVLRTIARVLKYMKHSFPFQK